MGRVRGSSHFLAHLLDERGASLFLSIRSCKLFMVINNTSLIIISNSGLRSSISQYIHNNVSKLRTDSFQLIIMEQNIIVTTKNLILHIKALDT